MYQTTIIKKTTFNVEVCNADSAYRPIRDCWIAPDGEIILNDSHHHVETLEKLDWNLKVKCKFGNSKINPHWVNDFKKANKNNGYDAGEFIIINLGYIAIEDYKVIYNSTRNGTSSKQRKLIACSSEKNDDNEYILILEKEILKKLQLKRQEKFNKEYKSLLSKRDYFEDWHNRFHCPSGCPRMEWIRFQRKCKIYGIDPTPYSEHRYFSS